MTEFYVPSTVLLSYVQKYSVEDLKAFSLREAVEFYRAFLNSSEEDIRSSCYLHLNDLMTYKVLRKKLRNKILGRDVKICFSLPKDVKIPVITEEDLEYYISVDVEALKELKLRKTRIIDRILTSDILFRLYYYLVQNYPEFQNYVLEFNKLETVISEAEYSISDRISSIIKENRESDLYPQYFNFYHPRILAGFKESCFPLLSWSKILTWGIRYIIFTDRHKELGLKSFKEKRIEECKTAFEKEVQDYIKRLEAVATAVKVLSTGALNEYEAFIYSMLPLALLEIGKLYNTATKIGLDFIELERTFNRLASTGKIKLVNGYFVKVEG
ncbi:MAG: hypothetical protein QW540_08165 [Archaeoglobaceae archaeon]